MQIGKYIFAFLPIDSESHRLSLPYQNHVSYGYKFKRGVVKSPMRKFGRDIPAGAFFTLSKIGFTTIPELKLGDGTRYHIEGCYFGLLIIKQLN